MLGRKGWTETWTNFESQYLGLGYEDGLGLGMGAALLCAPSQNENGNTVMEPTMHL